MNQLVTSSMVQVLSGEIKTTSLQVAEFFGKRPGNVLRDIEKIAADLTVLRAQDVNSNLSSSQKLDILCPLNFQGT